MISKSKRGLILILSSPSGAGKTTLAKKIQDSDSNFKISVSYTTRTPRPNEIDGVDYNFVNLNKFQELSNQNKFLEQAKVFGNYYGTLKGPIEDNLVQGKDYLFDIDCSSLAPRHPKLNKVLTHFNLIKVPFPSLEFSSDKTRFHWISF